MMMQARRWKYNLKCPQKLLKNKTGIWGWAGLLLTPLLPDKSGIRPQQATNANILKNSFPFSLFLFLIPYSWYSIWICDP
jgi:hypothetical protein